MTVAPTLNFSPTTPAAPSGQQNIVPQNDLGVSVCNQSFYDPLMLGDSGSGGTAGNVPAPPAGAAAAGKYLKADGTWAAPPGTGEGSVTSVALSVPSWQTVTGSPITATGTFTVSDNSQSANEVFAGPVSGSAAAPAFRALVEADLPSGYLSNPMTTEGDIIYGGASGAPTRLAAGTAGDLLQTNGAGTAPTWVTATGGSSQTTVAGSTSGSAVFSQPFQGAYYKKIIVLLQSLDGTASYTFPNSFAQMPDYFIGASAIGATLTALSTTAVTVSGLPSSGVIVLEGF
jgi:hypothetical protein